MRVISVIRSVLILATVAWLSAGQVSAAIITQWDFNAQYVTPDVMNNNPAPSIGAGRATPLGMTNSYSYSDSKHSTSSTTCSDVIDDTRYTTSDPATGINGQNILWRVRGSYDGTIANAGIGWNTAAPQYTQGAEFDVSTVGQANIVFAYDWGCTTHGVSAMQPQYTADGTNWLNVGSILYAPANVASNGHTLDFGALGIRTVDNDAHFGVRLVSVYDPRYYAANGTNSYGDAGTPTSAYNNSSGNWSFDMVTVSGTVAPEPSTLVLCATGLAAAAMMFLRRRIGK